MWENIAADQNALQDCTDAHADNVYGDILSLSDLKMKYVCSLPKDKFLLYEPHREKTDVLHMQTQRRRSASR